MSQQITITKHHGVDTVESIVVAEHLEIEHRALLQTVKKYQSQIETHFGRVAFEMLPFNTAGGKQNVQVAYLTEDQAIFISTLSRNSEKVVEFKVNLVKTFGEAKRLALSTQQQFSLPSTFSEALQLAANQAKQIEDQQALLDAAKPKVEFYEAVTGSSDTVDIGTVAKTLNFPKIGRTNLFEILRNEKVLMRDNKPFQAYVDRGWFRVVESSYSKPDGSSHVNFKTVVFQKGVEGIRKLLTEKYS